MSLISNGKATFNYEVIEKYEAGIELLGLEVKSIRGKHGSLDGAYVKFRGSELYLVGADIPPYQAGNTPAGYDRHRDRRILVRRGQALGLRQKTESDGLTLIPIALYNKASKVKVEIALAKGKKKFDKREAIKRREDSREIHRTIKGYIIKKS